MMIHVNFFHSSSKPNFTAAKNNSLLKIPRMRNVDHIAFRGQIDEANQQVASRSIARQYSVQLKTRKANFGHFFCFSVIWQISWLNAGSFSLPCVHI